MDKFRIELHAINPIKNTFRFYRLESGTDLFGDFIVVIRFGRIGTFGNSNTFAVTSINEARSIITERLKKRQTAPHRIGISYQIVDIFDPYNWWSEIQVNTSK